MRNRSGGIQHDIAVDDAGATASTRAPRIAAVERPFGLTVGLPDNAGDQLAVLRATRQALAAISELGGASISSFSGIMMRN
jgi:hypothetical protein